MQRVLSERRSEREGSIQLWLARAVIVTTLIVLAVAAAHVFAGTIPTPRSHASISIRPYGATQEPVHGNLSGGEDGSVAQVGGDGLLP